MGLVTRDTKTDPIYIVEGLKLDILGIIGSYKHKYNMTWEQIKTKLKLTDNELYIIKSTDNEMNKMTLNELALLVNKLGVSLKIGVDNEED